MIMTVAELRQFVTTDGIDPALLEVRLQALELLIRGYTNNNFQKRPLRAVAVAVADEGTLVCPTITPFREGDTLQISDSELNSGLVTVKAVDGQTVAVNEELYDESGVVVTKVVVTSFHMAGDDSSMGFPKSLLGFLKPYMKARFGQGLSV